MQVSQIIKVLQERYSLEDHLMVDWWDKEHFEMFCDQRGLSTPDWEEVINIYENLGDALDITDFWLDIIKEIGSEKA
jgi:regulator of sigma D